MKKIKGKVVTGLGEGQYYISKEGYMEQFNCKLGFYPTPGTLNLKITETFTLEDREPITIKGFEDESGTFGGCKCYRVLIGGIEGAIVRPERSSYPPDLVEVIAPSHLRTKLNLKDGDEVDVILE
jgi:riboflavin kinase